MRRAKLAVQKAEYDWQFSIFPHSICNTHTGIQAGERGSNQCNHYGYCQDSGEGDTVPAKHLVAENLRHVAYRRARAKGSRETAATAVVIAGIDEKVRREVFEEVEDNGLDNERQKHGQLAHRPYHARVLIGIALCRAELQPSPLGRRDATAGDLMNSLDFSQVHNQPIDQEKLDNSSYLAYFSTNT